MIISNTLSTDIVAVVVVVFVASSHFLRARESKRGARKRLQSGRKSTILSFSGLPHYVRAFSNPMRFRCFSCDLDKIKSENILDFKAKIKLLIETVHSFSF